jgi:hypothetical protein
LKENFNFNAQNKKLKGSKLKAKRDWKFEIYSVEYESYLFMFVIAMNRWMKPSLVSNMMESITMC